MFVNIGNTQVAERMLSLASLLYWWIKFYISSLHYYDFPRKHSCSLILWWLHILLYLYVALYYKLMNVHNFQRLFSRCSIETDTSVTVIVLQKRAELAQPKPFSRCLIISLSEAWNDCATSFTKIARSRTVSWLRDVVAKSSVSVDISQITNRLGLA